jgi:hypothetical protein
MMNEVKRQLIVPERLVSGSRLPVSIQVLMECPNCLYKHELPVESDWTGHPDRGEK